MSQQSRFWFILLSVVVVASVVLLAGALSTLDIDLEGQPLPDLGGEGAVPPAPPSPSAVEVIEMVMRVLLVGSAALLPFAVILFIVSPEARRTVTRNLLAMLTLLLLRYLLQQIPVQTPEVATDLPPPQVTPQTLPEAPEIAPVPSPSNWLVVAATIGLALLVAALLVGVASMIWRRRQRSPTSLDRLAQEAEDAVQAIEAGADLKDTVTRCYFEMMQVLKEERGIRRQQGMTPREFEAELENMGIPAAQVHRLTMLFEQVRYGGKHLGQQEERQALVSLTAISRFCRSTS